MFYNRLFAFDYNNIDLFTKDTILKNYVEPLSSLKFNVTTIYT